MNSLTAQLYKKDSKGKLGRRLFRAVRPFASAVAVIATSAILVFTIYYTQLSLQWATFLTGVLIAAILAAATRSARAEWIVMRRTAQWVSVKEKLERETRLRKKAEEEIGTGRPLLKLIDEVKWLMVAFVDADGRYQYHNHAFSDWLNLRPERINGRYMREVLGANNYGEIAAAVRQSLGGQKARYDQKRKLPSGTYITVSSEQIPQFSADGKVNGFYILATVLAEQADSPQSTEPKYPTADQSRQVTDTSGGRADQDMFVSSFSEEISGQRDEGKQILSAIEKGEFSLFCQLITPLAAGYGKAVHYEILLRLIEEEENMMPPGAFFPLAEKHGLMPHLDRWVVRHVMEHVAHQNLQEAPPKKSIYFINMSLATITDPGFPEFLKLALAEFGVSGSMFCFEIPNSELASRPAEIAEFARQVRLYGCCVALCGFGRDRVTFDQIQGIHVDFLKIDGSVILDILNDPVKLAKIIAINRVAKKIGIKTVAELVESEEIIAKLRELEIDFAQGFGISRPRPLDEIKL